MVVTVLSSTELVVVVVLNGITPSIISVKSVTSGQPASMLARYLFLQILSSIVTCLLGSRVL